MSGTYHSNYLPIKEIELCRNQWTVVDIFKFTLVFCLKLARNTNSTQYLVLLHQKNRIIENEVTYINMF